MEYGIYNEPNLEFLDPVNDFPELKLSDDEDWESDDDESVDDRGNIAEHSKQTRSKKPKGTINFISSRLVAALDKWKISDRAAVHIIIATAIALGHQVKDLIINRSTIRKIRLRNREISSKRIKEDFFVRLNEATRAKITLKR